MFKFNKITDEMNNIDYVEQRHSHIMGRNTVRSMKKLGVGIVLSACGLLVTKSCIPDISMSSLNPDPGQEQGNTKINEMIVSKLKTQSTSATGESNVKVVRAVQEWIDKKDKKTDEDIVHETQVFRNGEYSVQWTVGGKWHPALGDNGDIMVTLDGATSSRVSLEESPELDKDETGRAIWQSAAGILGAADTATGYGLENIYDTVVQWSENGKSASPFTRSVACLAIASAADNANSLVSLISDDQYIVETYVPPRGDIIKTEDRKTIRFQIPDPYTNELLSISSCLPELDGLGYNNEHQASDINSSYGLASHTFSDISLATEEQ
jgi:hypothetical protein